MRRELAINTDEDSGAAFLPEHFQPRDIQLYNMPPPELELSVNDAHVTDDQDDYIPLPFISDTGRSRRIRAHTRGLSNQAAFVVDRRIAHRAGVRAVEGRQVFTSEEV